MKFNLRSRKSSCFHKNISIKRVGRGSEYFNSRLNSAIVNIFTPFRRLEGLILRLIGAYFHKIDS